MMRIPDVPQRERVQLRAAWAEALGVTATVFDGEGITWVARDDLDVALVVELGAAMVVAAPRAVLPALEHQHRFTLRDADAIAALLPRSRAIGSSHLLFATARPAAPSHPVVVGDDRDLVKVREAVSPAEWDESGVEPMERHWAVREGGEPVAIAGYQRWRSTIAHIGVVATPLARGRGCAAAAATAAVCAAIDAGLVAQWRCRIGNAASLRLADRLGFTRIGAQSAVALARWS
ncbi:GNAT family N-acetyltransferase [Agrococcus beijingensis]|uniref:GNAT family N-acetyltransferase n=1 Tax=Agrococcus beijingensis TaxID=3068634 RepID=UPI0027411C61|nr:GNAT family N-acetyltransferase [Agrococcus sp. REN33]